MMKGRWWNVHRNINRRGADATLQISRVEILQEVDQIRPTKARTRSRNDDLENPVSISKLRDLDKPTAKIQNSSDMNRTSATLQDSLSRETPVSSRSRLESPLKPGDLLFIRNMNQILPLPSTCILKMLSLEKYSLLIETRFCILALSIPAIS
ncbi:unnamed protein product [Linum trigynum]|uniref:Uncharacterized protein n=1 Tax=Linum trigynum TaxID=586398 RepID=A0AAV2FWN3_9ROSI